jgi:hypothetical protein
MGHSFGIALGITKNEDTVIRTALTGRVVGLNNSFIEVGVSTNVE